MLRQTVIRSLTLALIFTAAVATVLGITENAAAAPRSDELSSNMRLSSGQHLDSPNGRYQLLIQANGNLVESEADGQTVWATRTRARDATVRMQADGNLVVIASGSRPIWATGTQHNPGSVLHVRDSGDIVVTSTDGQIIWSSRALRTTRLGHRIALLAETETHNSTHNHVAEPDCNYYSAALMAGEPCANGWRAEAWCADFTHWVWARAGASTETLDAGAASFYRYGISHHTWKAGSSAINAQVGDAVLFGLTSDRTSAKHVGIVQAVHADGTIDVTSGNNSHNSVGTITLTPGRQDISGYVSPSALGGIG